MKINLYAIGTVIFALVSVFSLFHSGLIPTHDGEYHVIRFFEFYTNQEEGVMYPRWAFSLNNGYGVPLFNYVYPLPNYVAALFHLGGLSFIDSFKASIILATILAGIFFYLWIKVFFNDKAAVVASVLYLYAPYRFVDIYVRGSIGEIWAFTFFPAFLWTITKYIEEEKKSYFIASAIFLALTIYSHNILGLMFFIFSIGYILILQLGKNLKHILKPLIIYILSLGVSAAFWVPALWEKKFVRGLDIYSINENFPEIYQLIFPSWGTGFSGGDLNNQMSFQIGVLHIVMVILASIFVFKEKTHKKIIIFLIFSFFFIAFLILPYSQSIWATVPLIHYFQFPWRFLSLIVLITSVLGGYVVYKVNNKIIIIVVCILAVAVTYGYTKPAYYLEREDSYYLTRSNFIDGTNSPGNLFNTIWMNPSLPKTNHIVNNEQGVTVKEIEKKGNKYVMLVDSNKETNLVLNVAYFPGWKVFVDEKETETSYNKDGLISFLLPKDTHAVKVVFKSTQIRTIAEITTVLSIFVLFILGILRRVKKI